MFIYNNSIVDSSLFEQVHSGSFIGSRSMLTRFSRYEHAIKTIRSTIRGVLEVRNGKKLATLICDKYFYGECGKDD